MAALPLEIAQPRTRRSGGARRERRRGRRPAGAVRGRCSPLFATGEALAVPVSVSLLPTRQFASIRHCTICRRLVPHVAKPWPHSWPRTQLVKRSSSRCARQRGRARGQSSAGRDGGRDARRAPRGGAQPLGALPWADAAALAPGQRGAAARALHLDPHDVDGFPIDAVFYDRAGRVTNVGRGVRPWIEGAFGGRGHLRVRLRLGTRGYSTRNALAGGASSGVATTSNRSL